MKGNEARVVFLLQPVDQFKDGEVAKVNRFYGYLGFRSLLLLGLLLGLGLLAYVLFQIEDQEPMVSTTTAPIPTTTKTTLTSDPATTDPATTTTNSVMPLPPITPGIQEQTKH